MVTRHVCGETRRPKAALLGSAPRFTGLSDAGPPVRALASLPVFVPVAEAGIRKLDGPTRAMALAALAGLVILGFAMMLLTWLAGRYFRRRSRHDQPAATRHDENDWLPRRDRRSCTGDDAVREPPTD